MVITFVLAALSIALLGYQFFFLAIYARSRRDLVDEARISHTAPDQLPTVAIIVPCWNEARVMTRAVSSLLDLTYPKDKLSLILIDDGSTDETWNIMQTFASHPQIAIAKKANGGKFTALNAGLAMTEAKLVGCLDADSMVDPSALKEIVPYFTRSDTMAVAPSVLVWQPRGILRRIQYAEYGFGIFMRKMMQFLNAIYITPGPFSIFRRQVFNELGPYKHAYGTEDIEIALRLQRHGRKIVHAHRAIVYSASPGDLRRLIKQRVRWAYGFLRNAWDFRGIFFRWHSRYLGILVLPMAFVAIGTVCLIGPTLAYKLVDALIRSIHSPETIEVKIPDKFLLVLDLLAILGTTFMVFLASRFSAGKFKFRLDSIIFLGLYLLVAPLWLLKALGHVLFAVRPSWR